MTKPRIAAIVPAFNRPKIVLEALESIAQQTQPPHRLVVVDDGSSNETPDNIQSWLDEKDLPFDAQLIRQENQGLAATRNRGVEACPDCDVLAFLDDDDIWPKDYVQRVSHSMAASPEAVAGTADRLDVDHRVDRTEFRDYADIGQNTTQRLLMHGSPGSCNTVFRADAFHKVGGYDPAERNAEDYQFMLRISLLGPWIHIPGEPVPIRRGLEEAVKYAPQLSRAYADRRHRLARILQKFIEEDGGMEAVPEAVWRRRVGRLWYSAGRDYWKAGQRAEAAECFARCRAIFPRHLRAWLWICRTGPSSATA